MATGSFTSKTYGYELYLYCEWSSSSSIEGNYSDVKMKLWINHDRLYVTSGTNDCTVSVGNVASKSWTGPDISSSGGRTYLGEQTIRVPHNNDGSKNCVLNASYRLNVTYGGAYIGTLDASKSIQLDTIARASSITGVTASVNMTGSNSVTINISRASASFKHKVQINLGGETRLVTNANIDTSYTYTIPASWCNYIPNAVSGTATVYVWTYSGGTQIGSYSSSVFKVTVPNEFTPTIGSFTSERVDNGVPPEWGLYVRTKSKTKLHINNAAGVYGSIVKSFSISGGGYSGTSSSLETGTLNNAGANKFTAIITDSRGRSAQRTLEITVTDYSTPIMTECLCFRSNSSGTANDDGTCITAKASASYAVCGGKNSLALSVKYRPVGGTWSSNTALSNGVSKVIGTGAIDVNKTYETDISLSDAFGSWHYNPPIIPTSYSIMDFKAGGKGLTIGGAAEEDGFVVKIPTKFTSTVNGTISNAANAAYATNSGNATSATKAASATNATTAVNANYLNVVSGNEIRINPASSSQSNLWINYKSANGSTNNIQTFYLGNGRGGSYADLYAASIVLNGALSCGNSSGTRKNLGMKRDIIYNGGTTGAVNFSSAGYDMIVAVGKPGSADSATTLVFPAGYYRQYQFADDGSYYSFSYTSSGIGGRIGGSGSLVMVIGLKFAP